MAFLNTQQTLGQRAAATATRLLTQYGDNVTFTRTIPGVFNPSTGGISSPSITQYQAQGVSSNFNEMELTNSTVQYGDMKYYILPPDGTTPQIGDTVVIGSIKYRIII